jgi:hypothetical protein
MGGVAHVQSSFALKSFINRGAPLPQAGQPTRW